MIEETPFETIKVFDTYNDDHYRLLFEIIDSQSRRIENLENIVYSSRNKHIKDKKYHD